MSTLEVNKITPSTGTSITLGDSGDTFTLPSGVTLTNNGTASGFGKIGQVVSASTATEVINTTTSNVDVGLSATITPTSTSSKIYVVISASCAGYTGSANNVKGICRILRNTTDTGYEFIHARLDAVTGGQTGGSESFSFLDSPSSTSALTYKVQQRLAGGSGGGRQVHFSFDNRSSVITLMEVLA